MWPISWIKESFSHFMSEPVREELSLLKNENWRLQESLGRIEVEIENEGYQRLSRLGEYTFSKDQLNEEIRRITQMAIHNPITSRTINVQADYVFGRGVRFVAADPTIQEWVDEFSDHRENRKTLTSGTAMRQEERALQIQGGRFYVLFTKADTGRVLVRCLDTMDVEDIIRDPQDYNKELYIRRRVMDKVVYHPMLWVTQGSGVQPPQFYSPDNPAGPIFWNAPVYHNRFNVFGKEKFAVPELFAQGAWTTVYKRFLENWSSTMESFARMAFKITGVTGSRQMAAMKKKMGTTVSTSSVAEKNPSQVAGSTGLLGRELDIEAVRTAGATTPAKEGSPLLDMAATAAGWPSHFYGDISNGNDTLDRTTELKVLARQELWREFFSNVIGYVVFTRAKVEFGAADVEDPFTGIIEAGPVWPKDIDHRVSIIFPDILEKNATDRVRALVNAVTMFGKPLTDIIPDKQLVARLLMEALNIPDIDKLLPVFMGMWEKNMKAEPGEPVEAGIIPPPVPQGGTGAEDAAQGGDVGANG